MIKKNRTPREIATLILIVLMACGMALFVPHFLDVRNLQTVGETAAFIGVMACGEAVVILCGGLDLSVGAIFALSSCVTAIVIIDLKWSWPLAIVAGLFAGAMAGFINGGLVTWRRLPPILTTLGTWFLFRNGTSILTHAKNYSPFPDAFTKISADWNPSLLFLIVTIFFVLVTTRTRFGRWDIAIGGGEQAVRLSGVDVDRVKRLAYTLSGLCAALGGIIAMAYNNNTQSSTGQGYELDVIAACVVGGIRITGGDGSILGAALGALLIALLRDALILTNRGQEEAGLFLGAVILAAAVLEQWRARRQSRYHLEVASSPLA